MAAADEQMCAVCQDVLNDGAAKESLPCAHQFHTECIESWGKATNPGGSWIDVPCPICKTVPREANEIPHILIGQGEPALGEPALVEEPPTLGEPALVEEPPTLVQQPDWVLDEPDWSLAPNFVGAAPIEFHTPILPPPHVEPALVEPALGEEPPTRFEPALVEEPESLEEAALVEEPPAPIQDGQVQSESDPEDVAPLVNQFPVDAPKGLGKAKKKPTARAKAKGKAKANKGGKAGGKANRKGGADGTLGDFFAKGNAKGNSKGERKEEPATLEEPPTLEEPALVEEPPAVDETIECHFCGESYPEFDCRLVSKTRGEFACVKCYTSRTLLYRFGEAPAKIMSEEDRHSFWLNCQSLKGSDKADLARQLKRKQVQSEMDSFAEGGEFLPLGVWKTKGFDAERIEANTTEDNKTEHSVLGTCYRVVIKSKHWKKDHGAVFEDENIYNQAPQISNLQLPAAASSSKDAADQIQAQLDKVKQLQEQAKADILTRKKFLLPLNKELIAMNKIARSIKAGKLPAVFMGANNPLLPAKKELEDLAAEAESAQSSALDVMGAKIAKAIEAAKLVQKAMKSFI